MTASRPPALFARILSSDPFPPLVVLGGDSAVLSGQLSSLLVETARGRGISSEATLLSPLDVENGLPLEAWRTPDFFVRHRTYALPEERDLRKDAKEDLAAWAESPSDGVTVIAPASRKDGHKAVRAFTGVVHVLPKGGREVADVLSRDAVARAALAGVILTPAAASFLVDWVGGDAGRVREEVEKVVLHAGTGRSAGEEDVRQVCVAAGGADPFRVARAVLDGNRAAFVSAFRKYAATAATEDYHALAGAIGWELRSRMKGGRGPLSPGTGERVARALWEIDRGMKGESGLSPGQYLEIRLLSILR